MIKTAMQEAIEIFEQELPITSKNIKWQIIKESILLKEKNQIVNAFNEGSRDCEAYWSDEPMLYNKELGQVYYKKKFKSTG